LPFADRRGGLIPNRGGLIIPVPQKELRNRRRLINQMVTP
jgi:hypothetical protein